MRTFTASPAVPDLHCKSGLEAVTDSQGSQAIVRSSASSRCAAAVVFCYLAFFALFVHGVCQEPEITAFDEPGQIEEVGDESAQPGTAALRLQALLQQKCDDSGVPAMWAGKFALGASTKEDRTVFAAAGVRKAGEAMVVSGDNLVHLGSCTKAMTAVLIAQLISDGKLRFDTTLRDVFASESAEVGSELEVRSKEGFEVVEFGESGWADVTVAELLQHRSGVPANAPWSSVHRKHPNSVVAARREVLRWLCERTVPKKKRFLYSNAGYCILGHIAEEIEGKPWEELIAERLFTPLGITSYGFGPVKGDEPLQEPWGHTIRSSVGSLVGELLGVSGGGKKPLAFKPIQIDNPPPLGPAGTVHMTIKDWAKFVRLITASYDRAIVINKNDDAAPYVGVTNEVWRQLLMPTDGGKYAGGWNILQREWANGIALNHAGSNTTWYCVAWVAPEKGFFVLVAANAFHENVAGVCDEVAAELVTKNTWLAQ